MATIVDPGDGQISGNAPGNYISLGKKPGDQVIISGSVGVTISGGTFAVPGVLVLGATNQALAIPAGSSAATNTTVTIPGTTWVSGTSAGIVLFDTKVNGSLGTVAYTFNDLVRALKVAGVIAQ